MFKILPKAARLATLIGMLVIVSACVQTGYSYNTAQFYQMKAGKTTLEEANAILGAQPTNIYRALDGSFTAMYSHKTSILPDAIYFNNELLLAFDNMGRFKHVVGGSGQTPNTEPSGNIKSGGNSTAIQAHNLSNNENQVQTTAIEEEVIIIENQGEPKTTIVETSIKETTTGNSSVNTPNTYPVYLKRSGSNVLKRYDMKN